jgi:carbon-monoxide dehydrogenase medium subunit
VPHERHAFEIFSRRHGDFAIAACAVTAVLEGDRLASLRIGVGGVADVPLVLDDVATGFLGETVDARSLGRMAEAVANAIDTNDQPEISGAYRRDLVKALMTRALQRVTAGTAGIAQQS